MTDNTVEVAFADQGYEGEKPAEAAAAQGVDLIVVKLPEAKKGFVLLPKPLGGRALVRLEPRGSADWSGTMSVMPPPWPDGTSSPSSVSCSDAQLYWQPVHNSL